MGIIAIACRIEIQYLSIIDASLTLARTGRVWNQAYNYMDLFCCNHECSPIRLQDKAITTASLPVVWIEAWKFAVCINRLDTRPSPRGLRVCWGSGFARSGNNDIDDTAQFICMSCCCSCLIVNMANYVLPSHRRLTGLSAVHCKTEIVVTANFWVTTVACTTLPTLIQRIQ